MAEGGSENIFDASRKQGEVSAKKKQAASSAPPPTKKAETNPPKTTEQMLERMQNLKKDIKGKLENIYKKTGVQPEAIHDYGKIANSEAWKKVQEDQKRLEDAMWSALGQDAKKAKAQREINKDSKARKAKMVGSRRRNWISMQ